MVSESLLGTELTVRKLVVCPKDVVFVKAIIQASDGLCCLFSDGGGELLLAAAEDRAADLQQLVQDLETELVGDGMGRSNVSTAVD
jgi:hypothetical protein